MKKLLSRNEIIDLIKEIYQLDESESDLAEAVDKQQSKLIDTLESGINHPAPTDLMYWEIPELTVEEIADKILAFKPGDQHDWAGAKFGETSEDDDPDEGRFVYRYTIGKR